MPSQMKNANTKVGALLVGIVLLINLLVATLGGYFLYQSRLLREGAVHTPLEEWSFAGGPRGVRA